jgi:glycosyltransferase involved in cell wall biosynthesis
VLEAWCAARPVIASRVGGLQSLIREGETGLFFDPDATDAANQLAAALVLLHKDSSLRQRLGEAGKEEAFAHYDWSRITDRLEKIYQLAESHANSRKEAL